MAQLVVEHHPHWQYCLALRRVFKLNLKGLLPYLHLLVEVEDQQLRTCLAVQSSHDAVGLLVLAAVEGSEAHYLLEATLEDQLLSDAVEGALQPQQPDLPVEQRHKHVLLEEPQAHHPQLPAPHLQRVRPLLLPPHQRPPAPFPATPALRPSLLPAQTRLHPRQVPVGPAHGLYLPGEVAVELGRAEFEVAFPGFLLEEGVVEGDVLLEAGAGVDEGVGDLDAIFE